MSADETKAANFGSVAAKYVRRTSERLANSSWSTTDIVSFMLASACSVFVLMVMNPHLLFTNTIPTGGDMGAHVWGPAYLRDELLPNLRLSGWAPDWYAGFPAYQFYMVVPALAIVGLNAGLSPWLGVPAAILATAGFVWLRKTFGLKTRFVVLGSFLTALLLISLPYGVAFKLITVVGLLFFPISVWFLARMARAPEPLPAFLALGATVFLFDASFWILGGNIMSTLAGEFSFSISLTFAFFALGLAFRGMDDNKWRARSAVVISLVALCHVIPVFFVVVMLAFTVLLGENFRRYPIIALTALLSLLLFLSGPNTAAAETIFSGSAGITSFWMSTYLALLGVVVSAAVVIYAVFRSTEVRSRLWWLALAGGVGALLAMFWLLPFWYQGDHFNDMGWTRLTEVGSKVLTTPMKVCLPIAAVGGITSLISRNRLGTLFSASAVVSLSAVANLPQGALWNERLLPFFYLSIYLLTAIAIASWVRALAVWHRRDFDRPSSWVMISGSMAAFALLLVGLSMPLRTLPFGQLQDDGSYTWGVFSSTERTKVPGWSAWNYAGYENRRSYAEYHHVVSTMAGLGAQVGADGSTGCGRAMWEFDDELDRYGTPMALMLLPYWTDGCIGSMEGLYFESSATTPFHFLNQSVLSQEPSRAQRDLPYADFDIDVGIAQLQTMGVRYYMALMDESIEAAREHPDLVEVADAAPFAVFEVQDSKLVEGLSYEPIVITDSAATVDDSTSDGEPAEETRFTEGWLSQAIEFYGDPDAYAALPAEDGPEEWQRMDTLVAAGDASEQVPVTVSEIEMGQNSVSFNVDEVGSPVLVKVSHFPNWNADGAEGPWRVGPNLMAVVPTAETVSLSYGRSAVDWLSKVMTLIGVAGVFVLWRVGRRRKPEAPQTLPSPFGPRSAREMTVENSVAVDAASIESSEPQEGEPDVGEPAPEPVLASIEVSESVPLAAGTTTDDPEDLSIQ